MKTERMLVILVFALVVGLPAGVANADFTFGEPTNLGLTVNSSLGDWDPSISADGLTLYFSSNRPGGHGSVDIWVTTRATTEDDWVTPVNLGPTVNTSSYKDEGPSISADGLSLYFTSEQRPGGFGDYDLYVSTRATKDDPWGASANLGSVVNGSGAGYPDISTDGLSLYFTGPGGFGDYDLYVSTRATKDDPWGEPSNLGSVVNSSSNESAPSISCDGLALYFGGIPPGGYGNGDLSVTTRATTNDDWGEPVNLGPGVNTAGWEAIPDISGDGSTLYFQSNRPGSVGDFDIWQVSIEPVVDLNGDGIVDSADMCIIVDHWGTDEPLCDIGPTPFGDGIVDVQDLIVLAEHLFEEIPPVE